MTQSVAPADSETLQRRGQPMLDLAPPPSTATILEQLQAIARTTALSPTQIVGRFAKVAVGPGKISFNDFVKLRLFEPHFTSDDVLKAFVGQRRNRDICLEVNFRHDWLGLLENKISALSYLAAYGFPTIPAAAIYTKGLKSRASHLLSDRGALGKFLASPENYPLFGKPVDGYQSLGSIGLCGVDPAARSLEAMDGASVPLDAFIDEIETAYPNGYVFQPFVRPHREIEKLCGPRLATVRMVTLLTNDGPILFRAAWKIPGGANLADNFWRAGNLLAKIDLQSGTVGRVISGSGIGTSDRARHPETGLPFDGFRHPDWSEMVSLALDGAQLMRHVPLIGWDIAATGSGPIIVEMNETPDFFLVQMAERKGVLDDTFRAFVADQRVRAAEHAKRSRALIARL
jgi:hypothetical protein